MKFVNAINEIYLQEEIVHQMRLSYKKMNVINIPLFLDQEIVNELKNNLEKVKGKKILLADRFSYSLLKDKINLFNDMAFLGFVGKIIGKQVKKTKYEVRSYEHGDYTLIHDSEKIKGRIEFFFVLCDNWESDWGGYKVYADSRGEKPLIFNPVGNSLVIIEKNNEMNSFLKYINCLAKDRRLIVVEGYFE